MCTQWTECARNIRRKSNQWTEALPTFVSVKLLWMYACSALFCRAVCDMQISVVLHEVTKYGTTCAFVIFMYMIYSLGGPFLPFQTSLEHPRMCARLQSLSDINSCPCAPAVDWTQKCGAHIFEILGSCTMPDVPTESLEILGCHDPAFG
jgi:hypothetical protein